MEQKSKITPTKKSKSPKAIEEENSQANLLQKYRHDTKVFNVCTKNNTP